MKPTFISGLLCLLVAGCSTLPEPRFGSMLDKSSMKFRVKLEGKGKIIVAQKLTGLRRCEDLKKLFTVKIREESNSTASPVTVTSSCTYLKSTLAAVSQNGLNPGSYVVEVSRKESGRSFDKNPLLQAKYDDPDFNSGGDYTVDGAKDLVAGQSLKGNVDYAQGNSTHWVRLKGKNTTVALTLVLNKDAKEVQAQVFDLPLGQEYPKLVGVLQPKGRRTFKLKEDNLVVRVSAKNSSAKGEYTLMRSDASGSGRALNIPVLDCYQVGEGSIVLLTKVEGMKVNDMITVFGKTPGGAQATLGHCQVNSIVDAQASCKMDSIPDQNYIEYRAEARL